MGNLEELWKLISFSSNLQEIILYNFAQPLIQEWQGMKVTVCMWSTDSLVSIRLTALLRNDHVW